MFKLTRQSSNLSVPTSTIASSKRISAVGMGSTKRCNGPSTPRSMALDLRGSPSIKVILLADNPQLIHNRNAAKYNRPDFPP